MANQPIAQVTDQGMGRWRRRLWPIYAHELSQFLPLFFMKFCVSFNYTILNATKDTVIVTTKGSGAEAIPVLKGGVVLFIAFIAMLVYSKLSNKLNRPKLFYTVLWPFIIFFLLYGFVLFPLRESLSPTVSSDWIISCIGSAHSHWVSVYRYWMNALFFVAAELWGGMMIGLLFWGFANQITSIKDAVRYYALYTVGGHVGTIAAGGLVVYFSNILNASFDIKVQILMSIVVVIGVTISALYWWTNRYVVSLGKVSREAAAVENEQSTKLSLKESLVYIFKSPHLGLIALMVIGYGISVNMVEVTWKAVLKIRYPNPDEYQAYMGGLQTAIGVVSLVIALFFSSNFLRYFGWRRSANLTPIVLGISSFIFFIGFFYLKHEFITEETRSASSLMALSVVTFIGAFHNVACKSMKYCMFDPTKEMAYIPLDQEAKIKGKAAVDLVGARFGKSGASWLQLLFIDLAGAGSILGVVPLLVPIVMIIIIIWMYATKQLSYKLADIGDATPLRRKKALTQPAFSKAKHYHPA